MRLPILNPQPDVAIVERVADDYTPINKGQFTLETQARAEEFERKRGAGVENDYRDNRRQWEELPRKKQVANYPLHVDIELSSLCNLKCPMCYTITPEFKEKVNAKLMDFALFTKIVDECAAGGVYSIRLSLRGESFLHKRIVDCIRYAKEKGIKEVSTLTNGLKLDEQMFTTIMEAGIDWITISIDGVGETYEKIRRPAKFARAVEKITNYQRIKQQAGRVKPVIKVQSILPAISDDPKAFYDIFAPITDMVSANPLIDYLQNDSLEAIQFVDNFSCPQLYQRLTIGADGQVMLCANDEENDHVVGNANTQTIHEIWHGEALTRVRDLHRQHRFRELHACRKCYLPRATQPTLVNIGQRQVVADNYINRPQIIGR